MRKRPGVPAQADPARDLQADPRTGALTRRLERNWAAWMRPLKESDAGGRHGCRTESAVARPAAGDRGEGVRTPFPPAVPFSFLSPVPPPGAEGEEGRCAAHRILWPGRGDPGRTTPPRRMGGAGQSRRARPNARERSGRAGPVNGTPGTGLALGGASGPLCGSNERTAVEVKKRLPRLGLSAKRRLKVRESGSKRRIPR